MGLTCAMSQCCGSESSMSSLLGPIRLNKQLSVPKEFLEPHQNIDITYKKLEDECDQVHRICGAPFIYMNVVEFMNDMAELADACTWQSMPVDGGQAIEIEVIPLATFLNHFSKKEEWTNHIMDKASPFNNVLRLDDLFTFNSSNPGDNFRNLNNSGGNYASNNS